MPDLLAADFRKLAVDGRCHRGSDENDGGARAAIPACPTGKARTSSTSPWPGAWHTFRAHPAIVQPLIGNKALRIEGCPGSDN